MGASSRLLYDEKPLVLIPELARTLKTIPGFSGIDEAVVLQQVHYWVILNQRANRNEHGGFFWTYNTFKDWSEKAFDGLYSISTLKRIFARLEKRGLVISGRFNKSNTDRTKWYRVNYDELDRLCQSDTMESVKLTLSKGQVDTMDSSPLTLSGHEGITNENPPPENTREYNQKITSENTSSSGKTRAPKLHRRRIFAEIQKYLGYPDKTDKDPIPNYGKEAKAIKRMVDRGYSEDEILEAWKTKSRKRGEYVSMVYVNEDIGKPERDTAGQARLFKEDDPDRFVKGKYGHMVNR